MAIQVAGIPGTARTSYTTPVLAVAEAVTAPSVWDRIIRSPITLFVILLTVAFLIAYAVFRIVYRPDQALTRRIGQFVTLPAAEQARQRQEQVDAALATPDRRASGRWQRLEEDIELARIEFPPLTLMLLTAVGGLVLGIILSIVIGSPVGLLAALVAPFVTNAAHQAAHHDDPEHLLATSFLTTSMSSRPGSGPGTALWERWPSAWTTLQSRRRASSSG